LNKPYSFFINNKDLYLLTNKHQKIIENVKENNNFSDVLEHKYLTNENFE
jgi:hypothetical protein